MVKFSLILPLYNSEKYVQECLESIKSQDFKDYGLIIIDDFSTDKTREIIKENGYSYYCNTSNQGFCYTVNKGIELAKGEYICILDHDMIYSPDYLSKILQEEGDIIAARSYYYKQRDKIRALNIEINPITGKTKVIGRDEIDRGQYDSLKEIDAIGAGSMTIKRKVFEDIGLFGINLIMYFVDVDFCLRARKKGYKIILSKAKCYHKKEEKEVLSKEQEERYFHDKLVFMHNFPVANLVTQIQNVLRKK